MLPEYRPKRCAARVEAFLRRVRKGGEPSLVYDPETLSFKDVAAKARVRHCKRNVSNCVVNCSTRHARWRLLGSQQRPVIFNMAEAILDDLA